MMLNAEDLTIQSVNPTYKQILHGRDVNGLPMTEVFSGKQVDSLLKAMKMSVRESQTLNTGPILASVDGEEKAQFDHTIVPINDATGSTVTRLFLYSEKLES